MKCEDFEFNCKSLFYMTIECHIGNHYNLINIDKSDIETPLNLEPGKSYNISIYAENKNLSCHIVGYENTDGSFTVKVSGVDVTQNRQRHR